jgi:hypothetical protein
MFILFRSKLCLVLTLLSLSKSQIIELYTKDENSDGLIIKTASSQKEITENKIPEGYSLTRYFFDKKINKWFVVFEKTK